jgi:two-component system response regulator
LEVLHEIKQDEHLRSIPVIVLSSSKAEQDVATAYEYQASCYINKPIDADQYFTAIRSLKELWFKVITLPARAAAP